MQQNSYNFRTDMADERVDEYKKVHNLSDITGIKVRTTNNNVLKVTTVDVLNNQGELAVGKPVGKYITIEIDDIININEEDKTKITEEVASQIKAVLGSPKKAIMVVGLGNEYVTPDALGPKVISDINVTRHVIKYAKEIAISNQVEVSAISPGVLGMTGIETEEIIEAVVKIVKPDAVIVIDSLASMSLTRLGRTIQLGNSGIVPGAGVGNKRKALNESTLGIPVIAIGVPTVVRLGTIMDEYLSKLKDNYEEIKGTLAEDNYNMIVTPKEIDELIENMKDVIARGINYAV